MKPLTKYLLAAGGACVAAALASRYVLRHARYFEFRGKVVLVTGGSRGLGLELARQLIDAGARVAICARNEEELRAAERELRARGGDVLAVRCDVRDPRQVQEMADRVRERWGTVEVLINNAGIIQVGPLDAMTLDDFHDAMAVNCWGALHTTLAVLPEMRRRGWGRIVNVASIGGKEAVPHLLPYVASKFALVGLSRGLRTELAKDGIVVTTVCPWLMRTGSPRNVIVKGQNRKEYAWFSLGDSLPLVSMDAASAAAKILRACQRGEVETIIAGAAAPAVKLSVLVSEWTTELLGVVNRLLPQMGGIGRRAAMGYESESALSPSLLTRLGDRAAERNNELLGQTPAAGGVAQAETT